MAVGLRGFAAATISIIYIRAAFYLKVVKQRKRPCRARSSTDVIEQSRSRDFRCWHLSEDQIRIDRVGSLVLRGRASQRARTNAAEQLARFLKVAEMGAGDHLQVDRRAKAGQLAQRRVHPFHDLLVLPRDGMAEGEHTGEEIAQRIERAQPGRALDRLDRPTERCCR